MKDDVIVRVNALNNEFELLFSIWKQYKPKNDILGNGENHVLQKSMIFLREKKEEFTNLVEKMHKIEYIFLIKIMN